MSPGCQAVSRRMSILIFGVWSVFFLYVGASGRLPLYINPRFAFVPLLGALLSGAMALAFAIRRAPAEEEARNEGWSLVTWLLMPIVLGVLVTPQGVGAFVAARRGSGLSASASEGVFSSALQSSAEYAPTTLLDLDRSGGTSAEKVSVEGQVSPGSTSVRKGEYLLTHYVMTCCAADLQPVSVILRGPAGFKPKDGQWVRVRAVVRHDSRGVILDAAMVEPMDQPTTPYLYP